MPVTPQAVTHLRAKGHNAVHAFDVGLGTKPDSEILVRRPDKSYADSVPPLECETIRPVESYAHSFVSSPPPQEGHGPSTFVARLNPSTQVQW